MFYICVPICKNVLYRLRVQISKKTPTQRRFNTRRTPFARSAFLAERCSNAVAVYSKRRFHAIANVPKRFLHRDERS